MHKTTLDLQAFYDHEADKFSGTRKRHWPEFSYIAEQILTHHSGAKTLRILELGCGDGRLLGYLQETLGCEIIYTGVDISYNLLAIANEAYPDARWIHKDMNTYLQTVDQESFDCVIAVASFHHLPLVAQRLEALENTYKGLVYNGIYIMTNRCYSDRFKQKFAKAIQKATWKSFLTLGYFNKHDIMVPRKNSAGVHIADRLYHIFSQKELNSLLKQAGFSYIHHVYIGNTGDITLDEKHGRNLVTSGVKSIYKS